MEKITYKLISPLVVEKYVSGSMVVCKFQAPGSKTVIIAAVSLFENSESPSKNLIGRLTDNVKHWMNGRRILNVGPTQLEDAAVKAFKTVAPHFEYANGLWTTRQRDRVL